MGFYGCSSARLEFYFCEVKKKRKKIVLPSFRYVHLNINAHTYILVGRVNKSEYTTNLHNIFDGFVECGCDMFDLKENASYLENTSYYYYYYKAEMSCSQYYDLRDMFILRVPIKHYSKMLLSVCIFFLYINIIL